MDSGLPKAMSGEAQLEPGEDICFICHETKFSDDEPITTQAEVRSFAIGTGHDVLKAIFSSIFESIEAELIFVTCFWARSTSLDLFVKLLRALSVRVLAARDAPKIKVRICFSSLSLTQKLFHTQSRAGMIYEPTVWMKKLGLPPPEALEGLDLQIKSVFMAPFSVLHPKFVIVDRRTCFVPSCNVSWETWFEGCVELRGPVIDCFLQFWEQIWCHGGIAEWDLKSQVTNSPFPSDEDLHGTSQHTNREAQMNSNATGAHLPQTIRLRNLRVENGLFLPSAYHRNPHFRPFPWQTIPKCPPTPLNNNALRIFMEAKRSIFLQSPNVTSPPVLVALHEALSRGVNVTIVTNERLMWLEQVVTAGTTTPRCLKPLIKAHSAMVQDSRKQRIRSDLEAARSPPGCLEIYYFSGPTAGASEESDSVPVSSHLKLTIVDDDIVVLGSGNMDRASWYTSQELGIGITSRSFAKLVREAVDAINSEYATMISTAFV